MHANRLHFGCLPTQFSMSMYTLFMLLNKYFTMVGKEVCIMLNDSMVIASS